MDGMSNRMNELSLEVKLKEKKRTSLELMVLVQEVNRARQSSDSREGQSTLSIITDR